MAGEWASFRLGDVCKKIGSGATPRGGASVYLDQGDVALIRSQNVHNDGFHRDGLVYLTEKHASELANVEVAVGDVLLNITGDSVARVCQVHPDVLPARVNQHVAIVRPDPSQLSARYLRYFLVSPWMQERMLSFAGAGATRNALTKGMIETIEVFAPVNVIEQRAIAQILGALDDKIELNRRMNATLEGMARALFQSWFVDFDPVRAKARGQQPAGLAPQIAALFPDALVETELGEAPVGWEIGAVENLGSVVCGKTPPTSDEDNYGTDVPFVTIPDMHGKVFVTTTSKSLSAKGAATQRTKYLPPYSVSVSCIATPGLVALTSAMCQTNQQINSVIPTDPNASLFCYFVLRGLGDQIRSHGTGGSVLLNVNRGQFSAMKILLPPEKVVHGFQSTTRPYFDRILSNEEQNGVLAALRDALLPRLISGQLRVADAERIAGRSL